MGRRARHSARTGDGGAELRARKRQLQDAEREQRAAELTFFDDPSDKESDSEQAGSDESEEEQEVLALGNGDGDDEEEADSNEEEEEEELDIDNDVDGFDAEEEKKKIMQMDGKWGKSRKNFYSADTAEFELESDEEVAKDEEEAALELQRKQAEMMDDEDFGFDHEDQEDDEEGAEESDEVSKGARGPVDDEDLVGEQLADIATLADDGFGAAGAAAGASIELVQRDFSKLSKKDKLQIVNQAAPELLGLMGELESTMKDLNEVVTPAIQKLKGVRRRSAAYNRGLQYLVTRQNLLLSYSTNISFYLLLRAEGKSVKDHPVLTHLLSLKKQMNKMEALDEALDDQLRDLLEKEFPSEVDEQVEDGMDQFFGKKQQDQKQSKRVSSGGAAPKASKKQKTSRSTVTDEERAEAERFYAEAARNREALAQAKKEFYSHDKPELAASSDDDSDLEGAKRGASYQIMKNKGLTAHKSKLNRNPRVKKRMQYRKAVIRRKGQVRDVRVGEAGKYGGETTGIKSNLSRSRKIRN